MLGDEGIEVAAADLLFALEHELDVDRQAARHGEERLARPRSGSASGLCRRTRRGRTAVRRAASGVNGWLCHCLQRVGRLDVVVAVDEHRRLARRAEPLAVHDGIAGGRQRAHGERTGGAERVGHPRRRAGDVGRVRRIRAHARNRGELQSSSSRIAISIRFEMREHPSRRHHLPPSIDSTWPVIQPAYSDAKNSTPCAMSSARAQPLQRDAVDERRWPSSPYDSHWRSVVGLERTKPGAMLFTVMPQGPSSWASWRVRPICAALADAYAWMPGEADAEPGAARDVDDAAGARRLHARRHGLGAVERAGHVDVEDDLPLLRRDLLERAAHLSEHAAGVVHQDVDAARSPQRPRRRRRPRRPCRARPRAPRGTGRPPPGTAAPSRAARHRSRRTPRPWRRARRTRRLMARPKPCAAPVTITVLPLKVEVHDVGGKAPQPACRALRATAAARLSRSRGSARPGAR